MQTGFCIEYRKQGLRSIESCFLLHPVTKTNAKCRIGRTTKELYAYLSANPGSVPTELDTVIGSISGKVLFTMCFPKSRLALAFLRDARTSQTCTRIFEKGMPFDSIEQRHVNLAMSHINSLTRDTLDGKCAYDAFVEELGEDGRLFLEKLGIVRIPANQVTLHPFLLGAKFQKIADRTILRKNGAITKKTTDQMKQEKPSSEGREP